MAKSPQKKGGRSEYRNENSFETPQCGAQCFDELFVEPELAVNVRRSRKGWLMCQRALIAPGHIDGEGLFFALSRQTSAEPEVTSLSQTQPPRRIGHVVSFWLIGAPAAKTAVRAQSGRSKVAPRRPTKLDDFDEVPPKEDSYMKVNVVGKSMIRG
jgi:hypothetical protein